MMLKKKYLLFKSIGKRKGRKTGSRCISKRKERIASICQPRYQLEDSRVMKFSLSSSVSSSSHGVQPLGNLYFSSPSHNSRDSGLGNLKSLTDELFLDVLGFLDPPDLCRLSTVSKSLYVFTNHEPLWRSIVLHKFSGCFSYYRSWKFTYVSSSNSSRISSVAPRQKLTVRDFYSDYLFQSWLCANLEIKAEWVERDNIERRRMISIEEFVSDFEEINRPVLLEGCLDEWEALRKWDRDYLVDVCGDVRFSVGPVEMKIGDFFGYCDQAREERPLYLFDPKFAEKVESLGLDYEVPEYFREDLFGILGRERPDYRWIIIGPAGSGSSFHIDPNSTSAWNAVIRGSKKWVLFPPDATPPGVHPSPDGAEVACPVSIIEWFMNFYEATKTWKKRPVECVCREGEVVFVPNGWWHLVINLEDSVAITQNYVSRRNVVNVLDFLSRPNAGELVSGTRDSARLHEKFRRSMEESYPGLVDELLIKSEERRNNQKKSSFWSSLTAPGSIPEPFKFSFY